MTPHRSLALALPLLLTLVLSFTACSVSTDSPSTSIAYFAFQGSDKQDTFIIQLTNTTRIVEARAILSGTQTNRFHVTGIIVPQKASYNPDWSYHLRPDSISFFELAMEVCDANMRYVEDHLAEVGGAFLPNNAWCPWASRLVREIPVDSIARP